MTQILSLVQGQNNNNENFSVPLMSRDKMTQWHSLPPLPWKHEKMNGAFSDMRVLTDVNGNPIVYFDGTDMQLVNLFMAAPHMSRALESMIRLFESRIDPLSASGIVMNAKHAMQLVKGF